MTQPMDMPSGDAERAGAGLLSTTASGTAGCNLDIEKIHGMSMILLNALGRRQALERCRRQERDAAPANAVARAVREEVERLCARSTPKARRGCNVGAPSRLSVGRPE